MSELHTLDPEMLCKRCKQELIKFRAQFDNDPRFCLELWRRALHGNLASVWEALTRCFTSQVRSWFYQHRLAPLALRYQPNDNYFVDETFTRIWLANHTKPIKVESLPKITDYARQTLNTVVLGACRPRKKEGPLPPDSGAGDPDDPPSAPPPKAPDMEGKIEENLDALELRERITSCTTNERERLVIDLIAFSGWKPRRICKDLHDDFPDVKEIYRILDNFRNRYKRRFP